MKTILSVVILSLFSLSALAAPKPKHAPSRSPSSARLNEDIYICQNSESDFTYAANRTRKRILVYENDHIPANGNPKLLRTIEDLEVKEKTILSIDGSKEEVSYTFYSKYIDGGVYQPIFEVELEHNKANSMITHAEGKVMSVKVSDKEDIDLNLHCKSKTE